MPTDMYYHPVCRARCGQQRWKLIDNKLLVSLSLYHVEQVFHAPMECNFEYKNFHSLLKALYYHPYLHIHGCHHTTSSADLEDVIWCDDYEPK